MVPLLTTERSHVPAVYLAGPLGFTSAGRQFHDSSVRGAVVAAGFTPLDPWDTSAPEAQAFVAAQGMSDPAIREVRVALAVRSLALRNLRMLDAADGVLAVLDGTDVDSGTAGEIGYASAIGTPIVGVRLDFRRTGEEGAGVNAQVEHFIERTGGLVLVCPPAVFHDSRAFLDAAVARLSLLILA